ncbi:MAG TPA: GlxA family transcriptional regulator [Steroidobacteraceae bacterium]|nr:GlxA family transcriptional regulator [Steroidobacteraceae bacterium]
MAVIAADIAPQPPAHWRERPACAIVARDASEPGAVVVKRAGEPARIAFFLVPQFPLIAFAAGLEPLRQANRMSERRLFDWPLVSVDGKAVTASNGIPIGVHGALDTLNGIDSVVVCAGLEPTQLGRHHKAHHHLRRLARHGSRIGAISTGSFILADAGLLGDHRCTVHWEYTDSLRSRHPGLKLTQDLYVIDRNVFTCSGGTSALDMMLQFVSEASGPELALAVAEQFIHPQIRHQQDQQRIGMHARYGIDSPKLVEIITLMEGAIEDPLEVTGIAQHVGVSPRQVERLFREHLNTSPRAFYVRLRLTRARTLLRQTLNSVRAVAVECGFASASHFCHAYKRVFGLSPTEERQRLTGGRPRRETDG